MPDTSTSSPFDRKQLQILFYVFLGLFTVLSILSLLIITNVIIVDEKIKEDARTLLFVSVAGAIIQAFSVAFLSFRAPDTATDYEIHISLIFPTTTGPINLDLTNCTYAIYDKDNNLIKKGTLQVHKKGIGWECVVRLKNAEDSVRLFLLDTTGKNWSTAYIGMKLITADAN